MTAILKPEIQIFKADGALAAYKAVKKGSDDKHVVAGTANTDKVIGISQNVVTTAEDIIEVAVNGGAKGLLGENVVQGDLLVSHADGRLVKPNAANDIIIAQAMEDGSSGEVIAVIITRGMASAAL